jgi:hypothetical protein
MPDDRALPGTGAAKSSGPSTESALIALAKACDAPVDIVRALYDREVAALAEQARIKHFIPVLACKHVKTDLKRLMCTHASQHAG